MSKKLPLAFLLTFTCYGTWLHGDKRGSVDKEHNIYGSEFVKSNERLNDKKETDLKTNIISLDQSQRKIIEKTIEEVCHHRQWELKAVNARTNHVHAVVSGNADPDKMINDFKSYSTRRLVESGHFEKGTRLWTSGGSTRYLWYEKSIDAACRYVNEQ